MKFILNKDKLEIQNIGEQNSGSINYYIADVEYDSSWNGLTIEAVIIKRDDEIGISRPIVNNKVYIDKEYQGQYFIGFKGYTIENNVKTYQISSNLVAIYFDKGAGEIEVQNGELPKPSEWEIYINQANEIIDKANNLDIDAIKVDNVATITLNKKDGTQKTVQIADGISLDFIWQGTYLGIKTSDSDIYTYVDLKGAKGDTGEAFQIKKTYATIQAMIADYDNMEINDYVMIDGNIEQSENATLWVKEETEDVTYRWHYLADFSGASGIQGETGATPNIQIGTVTSGDTPSVTRTGTDENPILNFVLEKGDQGNQGNPGPTGNGISSITKTGTSGLVDTYTITYTNGNTTTFTVTNGQDGEVTGAELNQVKEETNRIKDTILETTSGTGEIITLNNTAELQFAKAPLPRGNTKQNGTPTPDNPVTIDNVTGNVNVTVSTINRLAYPSDFSETYGGSTITQSKGIYTISGAATGGAFSEERSITNYTIKTNDYLHIGNIVADANSAILLVFSDNTNITRTISPTNMIVDLSSYVGKTIKGIKWYHNSSYTGQTIVCKPMIINNVSTEISFVEHKSQNKTFPLGTEKMYLGDYLADDGIHHVRGKVTLDGSNDETYGIAGEGDITNGFSMYAINAPTFIPNIKNVTNKILLSNYFNFVPRSSVNSSTLNFVTGGASTSIVLNINKTLLSEASVAGFKAWLSQNPIELEYELEEEDIVPYTQEQQTAYNEIKAMLSYEGQTNIYSTNEVSPLFNVEAYKVQDLSGKEDKSNKVTSISSASTDTQYPSAKCIYDIIGNIESLLSEV